MAETDVIQCYLCNCVITQIGIKGIYGRMLSLDIGWHWWLKKLWNILAFFKKYVTSFLVTNNRCLNGTFLPLTKALSTDQDAFADVDGLDN